MADDIKTTIAAQTSAPSNETTDGQSITERALADLVEADKYISGTSALKKKRLGMVVRKITPGDALG